MIKPKSIQFSFLVSMICTFFVFFMNHGSFAIINAYAGMPISQKPPVTFAYRLIGLAALIMFLSHFIISVYKVIKHENQVDQASIHMFNNVVYNPTLINDLQLLGSCTLFVLAASVPRLIYEGKAPETADEVLLFWLPARWIFGFVNPALTVYFNPVIAAHVKRDFWECWAPDWMQKYNPFMIQIDPVNSMH